MLIRHNKLILSILFIFNFILAQPDSSGVCQMFCCVDPSPTGVMISHSHLKKEWMMSYRYSTMNMEGNYQSGVKISENEINSNYLMNSKSMQMDMHMIMAMYGISNKFTIMGMLHYMKNMMQMDMSSSHDMSMHMGENKHAHHMTTQGMGDSKIYILYNIFENHHQHLLGSIGINIPTGSIQMTGDTQSMYPGFRYPYAMQLGSGTVDIFPIINYISKYNRLYFSSQFGAIIRPYKNSIGYSLGNELNSNSWVAYQWFQFISSSVRLTGQINEPISGNDITLYKYYEPAANTYNYGGYQLIGWLGSNLYIKIKSANIKVTGEFGLPLYQYYYGIQMNQKDAFNLSLSTTF
ncbi:MAG: transporter [Bacteroidota bacterium]|nr:transporter [Bacteroidota bacterium]